MDNKFRQKKEKDKPTDSQVTNREASLKQHRDRAAMIEAARQNQASQADERLTIRAFPKWEDIQSKEQLPTADERLTIRAFPKWEDIQSKEQLPTTDERLTIRAFPKWEDIQSKEQLPTTDERLTIRAFPKWEDIQPTQKNSDSQTESTSNNNKDHTTQVETRQRQIEKDTKLARHLQQDEEPDTHSNHEHVQDTHESNQDYLIPTDLLQKLVDYSIRCKESNTDFSSTNFLKILGETDTNKRVVIADADMITCRLYLNSKKLSEDIRKPVYNKLRSMQLSHVNKSRTAKLVKNMNPEQIRSRNESSKKYRFNKNPS